MNSAVKCLLMALLLAEILGVIACDWMSRPQYNIHGNRNFREDLYQCRRDGQIAKTAGKSAAIWTGDCMRAKGWRYKKK